MQVKNDKHSINYNKLMQYVESCYMLTNISNIVTWDFTTKMPKNSANIRADEIANLESIYLERFSNPIIGDLIDKVKDEELTDFQKRNIQLLEKKYKSISHTDKKLKASLTKQSFKCENIWRQAKKESNFNLVKNELNNLFDLTQEYATNLKDIFGFTTNYQALVDQYDPDRDIAEIDNNFALIAKKLPVFIENIINNQGSKPNLKFNETVESQFAIGKKIMQDFEFDFSRGRLDTTIHPFCIGNPNDVRMTSFDNCNDFIDGLYAIIHETGHALYELNRPIEYMNQPIGQHLGLAMHESQSLLAEYQVARSAEYCNYLAKKLHEHNNNYNFSADELYRYINHVKKSFIRVAADEVTYPLHVIIRYELEKELFAGKIAINDIEEAWNSKFQKYLGIQPESSSQGCLQDIHWYKGSFGYFHTYLYGSMTAAQVMQATKNKLPNLDNQISEGNFKDFNKLINKNIRNLASTKSFKEVMTDFTGQTLNAEIFLKYIENKYLG